MAARLMSFGKWGSTGRAQPIWLSLKQGTGEWGMGNGQWGTGNGQCGMGNARIGQSQFNMSTCAAFNIMTQTNCHVV